MAAVRIKPGEHVAILGKTGAGKSYAYKHLFQKAFKKQHNGVLVVLDNKREYSSIKAQATSPRQLNSMLYGSDRPPKVIRAIPSQPVEAVAEEYLRAAWGPDDLTMDYRPRFGVRFFIEDMPTFYDSPYKTPYYLRYWVTTGRAFERVIMGCSQRAQLTSKTFLCMCDHLFIFSMSDYDVDKFLVPIHGYRVAQAVKNLPKYGYVLVSDLYKEPISFPPVKGPLTKSKKGILIPVEYG